MIWTVKTTGGIRRVAEVQWRALVARGTIASAHGGARGKWTRAGRADGATVGRRAIGTDR